MNSKCRLFFYSSLFHATSPIFTVFTIWEQEKSIIKQAVFTVSHAGLHHGFLFIYFFWGVGGVTRMTWHHIMDFQMFHMLSEVNQIPDVMMDSSFNFRPKADSGLTQRAWMCLVCPASLCPCPRSPQLCNMLTLRLYGWCLLLNPQLCTNKKTRVAWKLVTVIITWYSL